MPDPTAQVVVDAIRFALMAQTDEAERMKLVEALLDMAPETEDNGGFDLLRDLAAEGSVKFSLVDFDSGESTAKGAREDA